MTSKRRCTGVDATSSRRIDVSPTSFQRHVSAGGWMVRIRAQLMDGWMFELFIDAQPQ